MHFVARFLIDQLILSLWYIRVHLGFSARQSVEQTDALHSDELVQAGSVDKRVCSEVDEGDDQQAVVERRRPERALAAQHSDEHELVGKPADDEARGDDQHRRNDVLLLLAQRIGMLTADSGSVGG